MAENVDRAWLGTDSLAVRLTSTFSEDYLVADLAKIEPSAWVAVLEGRSDKMWEGVALRSHDGQTSTMGVGSDYRDTPLLDQLAYVRSIFDGFECPLKRARLLALKPGATIGVHTDASSEEAKHEVRLHIPIVTNRGVIFKICDERVFMHPGELWFINVAQPHSLSNEGADSRVHLVIDCVVNDWLCRKLNASDNEVIRKPS